MANTNTMDFNQPIDDTLDTASKIKDQVSAAASKARDTAGDVGRRVQQKIDETRVPAADKLRSAASTLHAKAGSLPGGETVSGLAHRAAGTLEATSDYVRDHDVEAAMADVKTVVRKNPGRSLLIAAALGFLAGRAFRRA